MRKWLLVLASIGCASSLEGNGNESENEGNSCDEAPYICDGGIVYTCDENGERVEYGACSGNCLEGLCDTNECPDASAAVVTCSEDGLYTECLPEIGVTSNLRACPSGQACWDGGCQVQVCSPNSLGCQDEATPVLCDALGSTAEVLETCATNEECLSGACVDRCGVVAGTVGCDFYATDNDTLDLPDDGYQYTIIIANPADPEGGPTAEVTLDNLLTGDVATASVLPGQAHTFYTTCAGGAGSFACNSANLWGDQHPEGTGLYEDYAFHVTTDNPVIAYQLNSDDINAAAGSTSATVLLPVNVLGKTYYAISWPHSSTGASIVSVLGTEDDTAVTVRFSDDTAAGGEIDEYDADASGSFTVNHGDILEFASRGLGDDLTGTFVESNKPIAVFAGNEDAPAGGSGPFAFNQDAMYEIMLPVAAWGTGYVAAAAPIYPSGCAGSFGISETVFIWRVLASEDDTTVTFDGDASLNLPESIDLQLAGEFYEFTVTGTAVNRGHFAINSDVDKPISVSEYITAGPTGQVLMVPVEQFLPRYAFATTEWFNDVLTIIRPSGISVLVDGLSPTGLWTAAGADHEVLSMGICTDGVAHTVNGEDGIDEGQQFGVIISGNGGSCTYAYQGGFAVEFINPID